MSSSTEACAGADPQPINVLGNYTQNAGGTLQLKRSGLRGYAIDNEEKNRVFAASAQPCAVILESYLQHQRLGAGV